MATGDVMPARKAQRQSPRREAEAEASRAEPLRILLVGRTGLDGRLRLDPAIELIRAKTPLDAVGELGTALKHDGDLPTVIIVAASGEPSEPAGNSRDFVAALRRLDPRVRIMRLSDNTDSGGEDYDAMLNTDAGADDIRALLRGDAVAVADTGPAEPAIAQPEAPAGTAPQQLSSLIDSPAIASSSSDLGDEVLVRLLLHGRDITDAGLDLIRRRLGGRDVVYVTAGRATAGGSADMAASESASMHETTVAWRGRILGRLRSEEVSADHLAPHAAWLASWLILRDQHAQLREAAFADPLTGAHNRRYFDQFLGMAMDEARRERRGVTLLMFDIDDFKRFNDRYGHAAGDEILRETVRLLRSVIRPTDKVCRIGGDEFAVIFYEPTGPRTPSSRPPSDVCQIAERFQREITSHKFPKLGREAPGALGVSGGLATYPWDGMTPETLLARADELAMQSKRAGKNCITIGPGAEEDRAQVDDDQG